MKNTYAQKYNFSSNNSIGLIPWDVDFLEEIELLAQSLSRKHAHFCAVNSDNVEVFSSAFDMCDNSNDVNSFGIYDNSHACDSHDSSSVYNSNSHEDYVTNKHNVILVFPHGRPRRYLEDRYRQMAQEAGKAHILPHIITGNDFLSLCLSHWEREQIPYEELQALDRISLLHEAVIRVAKNLPESAVLRRLVEVTQKDKELYKEKKARQKIRNTEESKNKKNIDTNDEEGMYSSEYMDEKSLSLAKFFPWAHSLDALFEECFQQLIDVIDIVHAEGEVSAFAAALLSALRSIHTEYIRLLKTDEILSTIDDNASVPVSRRSTPAFSGYRAAQFIEAYSTYLNAQEKNIVFEFAPNRVDTIGVNSWSEEERGLFFDNFMPEIFKDKIIIFAGFVRLTEAEESLYKYFWKNGASIVWHSDPALADSALTDSASSNENDPRICEPDLYEPDLYETDATYTGDTTYTDGSTGINDINETDETDDTDSNGDKVNKADDAYKNLYKKVHYSCADHVEWLQRWKSNCTLLCESRADKPRIHFYAAYDAHSQVEALKDDLKNCVNTLLQESKIQEAEGRKDKSSYDLSGDLSDGLVSDLLNDLSGELPNGSPSKLSGDLSSDSVDSYDSANFVNSSDSCTSANVANSSNFIDSADSPDSFDEDINPYTSISDDTLAVLLPKSSLLMPILHALPEKDINISMGYPVNRTLLGQFIELIIRLQENKQTKSNNEMCFSVTSRRKNTKNELSQNVDIAHHSPHSIDIVGNINSNTSENTNGDISEENNSENRIWYGWKDILSLLRHPYARMLVPYDSALVSDALADDEKGFSGKDENNFDVEAAEKEKGEWRSLLYLLEKSLREGNVSLNIEDFLDDVLGDIDNKNFTVSQNLDGFISEFFEYSVGVWERIESLHDVAHALECFIDFLLKHGSVLWQSFPLDAEALVRCVEKIVPALRDNSLAHEYLPLDALFTVFRQLFNEERIPFEADPLSGMQILGMLESRLLRFRKIFIMDMTEDNLPGIMQQDLLMPDSLRNLLSLPDTHKREILTAHTFYRLIAGAEDVWLYWQEGIQSSEIQSSKSLRSRFVEECLWKEEKKEGRIVKNGDAFLRSADCRPIAPLRQSKKNIPCTELVKERLRSFFEKPLSSSALDMYIHCPAKFFYTYLGGLGELEEVSEGDDYRELGVWLHQLLQDTYKDFIGQSFEHNPKNFEVLLDLFHTRLHSPDVGKFISPESYFMLARAGEYHLTNYWESMPYIIQPMSLENKYECDVPFGLFAHNSLGVTKIKLQGRFDRVDMRIAQDVAEDISESIRQSTVSNLNAYQIYGVTEDTLDYKEIVNSEGEGDNLFPKGIECQSDSSKCEQFIRTSEVFKSVENELLPSILSSTSLSSAFFSQATSSQVTPSPLAFSQEASTPVSTFYESESCELPDTGNEEKFCKENFLEGVEHWILDYKTGKGQKLNKKIWGNNTLWNAIREVNKEKTQCKHDDILQEISLLMPNIQLPFYLYVYGKNFPQVLCNAGWIFLGEEKKEVPLVEIQIPKTVQKRKKMANKTRTAEHNSSADMHEKSDGDISDAAGEETTVYSWELLHSIKTRFMPELLEFSLNHLLQAQSFKAVEGKTCTYCPHKDYC